MIGNKKKLLFTVSIITILMSTANVGDCKVKELIVDNAIKENNLSILSVKKIAENQSIEKERIEKYKKIEEENIKKNKEILRKKKIGFNKLDITIPSFLTAEELYGLLEDRNVTFPDCAWSIIDAENIYGINAFVLSSIAILESQHGRSEFSESLNNLTGYAAFDGTGTAKQFTSQADGLYETARLLREEYINKDGKYYTGPSLSDINSLYSSSDDWHINIDTISSELLNTYNELY